MTSLKSLVTQEQLDFFQKTVEDNYSNAVEHFDFMPKLVFGKGAVFKASELPPEQHVIERTFPVPRKEDGRTVIDTWFVRLSPATIIRGKGKTAERFFIYPGFREKMVEGAIRKIALDEQSLLVKDGAVGCRFTMYQVRQLLADVKHTLSWREVAEAIEVLGGCSMEYGFVEPSGKFKVTDKSPLFTRVMKATKKGASDDETLSVVFFHHLVSESIRQGTYRNFDFQRCMTYRLAITQVLYERLCFRFRYADEHSTYSFRLSEFAQGAGMENQDAKEQVRNLKRGLEELKADDVLADYSVTHEPSPHDKRKRLDTIFTVRATATFVRDTIKVNAWSRKIAGEQMAKLTGGKPNGQKA